MMLEKCFFIELNLGRLEGRLGTDFQAIFASLWLSLEFQVLYAVKRNSQNYLGKYIEPINCKKIFAKNVPIQFRRLYHALCDVSFSLNIFSASFYG